MKVNSLHTSEIIPNVEMSKMPLMNVMKASKKSLTNVEQIKIYMNDMRAVKLTFDKSSTVHAVYDVSDKGYLTHTLAVTTLYTTWTQPLTLSFTYHRNLLAKRRTTVGVSKSIIHAGRTNDDIAVKTVKKKVRKSDLFYDYICRFVRLLFLIYHSHFWAYSYRLTDAVDQLFAFVYRLPILKTSTNFVDGWKLYSPVKEFNV